MPLAARVELIRDMCRAVRHRGPDDQGVRVDEAAAIGMRRLSIIDVAGGHQPLSNEDETVWTVFNGEIYNFAELRRELEAAGHRFRTASDTEVIVHGYEEWGRGAVARFRGMFALAVWDTRRRTLLLARDRVGIKPVYYSVAGGRLYFGSEIKSLLCSTDIPRRVDVDALNHYLSFLYTPRDGSIFQGVAKLPPGHMLVWNGGAIQIERYWQAAAQEPFAGSEDDAVDALREVVRDAVRSHMVSDVPIGAFLSGGVDSSLVVALMSEASTALVKTFSIGFDEPAFDELEYARQVAAHCGTDHHELVVRPDGLAVLDALIGHFDEPFGDASAIPTWYVSEMARRHVTVVLSGDGGDELFGGYERYLPSSRLARVDRYAPPGLRRVAGMAARRLPHGTRGKNFLRHVGRGDRDRYVDAVRYFSADEKPALLSPDIRGALSARDPEASLAAHFDRYADLSFASQMMRCDFETYLPEDVLTKVDRMSMAHSIESRVPLLDNKVVDFAESLPAAFKIRDRRQKHVLKEVAAAFLPRAVLQRRKQGFAVPLDTWFRGSLRELFTETLLSPTARQRGYFQAPFVARLIEEHLAGRRDHALRLWQLVVFERWHQRYLDRAPAGESAPLAASVG